MSRAIKCFKSSIFAPSLSQEKRVIFLENFSADKAGEAAKSLEHALESPDQIKKNADLADFLKKDPESALGAVDTQTKDLKGSTNEKTKDSVAAVDEFIDALVAKYDGSETAKSLFERDLIASFQENGGSEKIRKIIGMKSLRIDRTEIELRNGKVVVSGINSKTDSSYFMTEFPLKSKIREQAEAKHASIIRRTTIAIAQESNVVVPGKPAGPRPEETPPFRSRIRPDLHKDERRTEPEPVVVKDKAKIAEEEGEKREEEAKRTRENQDSIDTAPIYTPEELNELIHREVLLEKGVFQNWSSRDVHDPLAFNQITNSESLRNLIAQEPFKWSPGQLHKAIQDGNNQIVEFDDLIDEEGLGLMDDNDFVEEYAKVVAQVRTNPRDKEANEKLDNYNRTIAQAKRIMDALEPDKFKFNKLEKENSGDLAYKDMLGRAQTYEVASTAAKAPKVDHYYSFDKLQSNKLTAQGDYEDKDSKTLIGVDAKIFKDWKEALKAHLHDFLKQKYKKGDYGNDQWGFERSKIDRMEEVTLLRLIRDVYGDSQLIQEGHLVKFPSKDGDKLVLTSIPADFKVGNPAFDKLFKSIEWKQAGFMDNAFTYDTTEATKAHLEKADDSGKVDSYLKKVFDKNHIGELVDGGGGQIMDITLADGVHSTVFKDQFKAYMTGESAYVNSKDEIWGAAEMDATAEGKGREAFGQYTVDKTVTLINAYIDLGNLNSAAVFGSKKEVPKITAEDIYNQKVTEEQIKAAQMGATIEWTQAAKFDALEGLAEEKPALYAVTRQLFWNNPGMGPDKQKAIVEAIRHIDLGTIAAYFKTDQDGKLDTWGLGYNKSFPLPYGLSLNFSAGGFKTQETGGGIVGGGVGGSHELGEKGRYGKINWGISAGAAISGLGTGPFVAATVSYDIEVSDAYDFSVGAFVGSDVTSLIKWGFNVGVKADVQRSYNLQLAEKYHEMGFDELNKILQNPEVPIEQKALAIENNKACGPLMKKMVTVFEEMQKKFGRPVSEHMRQDLLLQTYNTILTNVKMEHDQQWTPELLNSIGITLEISPNLFTTFEALIGGLISINIKGKTYAIPVAPQGIPSANESVLTKQLMDNLRARLAKQQGVSKANVEITPAILSQEGLLVRAAGAHGFEYRATTAQEITGTAELTKKDQTYEAVQEAFDDAHIAFNRDSDPTSFTMDVKNYGNKPLENANVVLSVDPKLRPFVDVIGDNRNQFKVRFKDGFKQFGRLLVSRQDIVAPMRNAGAPKLVKIMLKADTTSDSTLEQLNDFTGLYKYPGYQVVEKGSKSKDNNLWGNMKEYRADLAKGPAGNFLQLNEKDLSEAEKAQMEADKTTISEHKKLWGIEAQKMRSHGELDEIVSGFMTSIVNSADPEYKALYKAIKGDKLATQQQTDKIMEGLQKYAKESGKGELNPYELEYSKNLFSLHTFTNVTKYYVEGGDSEAIANNKLIGLQKILRQRINLFGRIADQIFSRTHEGSNPRVRKEMVKYLKDRMLGKVNNLTVEDIKLSNLSNISRDTLGQFLGSMAGRLMDVRQGRLADLDTYGSISPDDANNMMAYGVEELSVNADGMEGRVARAIVEIEYPHEQLLEAHEFLNQPLAVQVGVNAEKFFTSKEVAQLDQIKKGEALTDELQKVFSKFQNLVNTIRGMQMSAKGIISVPDLGPEYKHAAVVVKPMGVKDFFFEQCGNHSWGVDTGLQFFTPQESERPVFAGAMVKGRLGIGTGTQVSYWTIGLGVFGERKVKEVPTEEKVKDFKKNEHTESTKDKSGQDTYTTTNDPEGATGTGPGTPAAPDSAKPLPNASAARTPTETPRGGVSTNNSTGEATDGNPGGPK